MTRGGGPQITPEEAEELRARAPRSPSAAPSGRSEGKTKAPAAIAHQRASARRHAELKRAIINALRLEGAWVWGQPTGSAWRGKHLIPFGVAGMPDIVGSVPVPCSHDPQRETHSAGCGGTGLPRPFGCEVKVGEGRPSADQLAWADEAAARGWLVIREARSVAQVIEVVRAVMR